MLDPRITRLARILIRYSCDLKPGERILIDAVGIDTPLVTELVREAYEAGGIPIVELRDPRVTRAILRGGNAQTFTQMADIDAPRMEQMHAYIGIRGGDNAYELSDVPSDINALYHRLYWERVHSAIRVAKTKWVVLRYPSPSMAQLASASLEQFENFYFDVCCLDYSKMDRAMDALVALMGRTDRVRITGKNTDLRFSIKGIATIKCSGRSNIPDGEVFTAPVRDSVNGVITYNTPALMDGFAYEDVRLEFKDGKIISASANDTEKCNAIFDTDAGARYVGEFAIGVNPYITKPMRDTLFDEKIAGSIHFTPGSCYDDASNGNKSAIHWDLVFIQTPEYGGGEIYFDDVMIRKDGRFVLPELEPLNPENLV